jgi:Mce-associated membrane protein
MPGTSESEAPDADDAVSAEAAEAAAAAAEERAEAARARANELRRKLEASRGETPADAVTADASGDAATETVEETEAVEEVDPAEPIGVLPPERRRGVRWPLVAAGIVALLVIVAVLGFAGNMWWQHREAQAQQHRSAEFAAAARQGVVNLMSLDYTHAQETVQRVIDDSTGKFKSNFEDGSGDLIKALTDAKVITKVTVNNTAVESMDRDSATVLVAATSQRTGPDAPKEDQQPRVWRVVVSLVREGDQLKVSDVEFV